MDLKLKEQADAAIAKWTPLAVDAEEARATAPLHVLLGEAVDVASMMTHYWEPRVDKGRRIPGFAGVTSNQTVTPELATEIKELQLAVATAHSEYLVLVQSAADTPLDRADFVMSEIRSTLEFLFDDGKHDEADVQLENLRAAFADSASQDAMALALEGYSELAGRHRDALAKIDGFEITLIEEARQLAEALRQQSAAALIRTTPDAQRQALSLRNRLLMLLLERVKRVRRTAAYVFRNHPEIVRKFTSAYERRRRTAQKKASVETPETDAGANGAAAGATA
jgi:hypothetical protein